MQTLQVLINLFDFELATEEHKRMQPLNCVLFILFDQSGTAELASRVYGNLSVGFALQVSLGGLHAGLGAAAYYPKIA